jgi:MscS family membrane protein
MEQSYKPEGQARRSAKGMVFWPAALRLACASGSLAAQDAMKSYFGTLLLIGERVFKIGDRITVNGNQGIVEQVGFRSTRLRTKAGSLLTVPNSVIAAAAIENLGTVTPEAESPAALQPRAA